MMRQIVRLFEGVALVASGVPNQVQAGNVHCSQSTHISAAPRGPRLPDRFCTPLQQQWSSRYRLRSATGTNYSVPRRPTRTKFGDRAFSVAGPVVRNSLPAAVRHTRTVYTVLNADSNRTFLACVLMIDSVV